MAIGRMNISQTKHEKTNNFSESQADRTNPKLIRVNFSLLLLVFAKPAWTAVRINSPEDVNADAIVAAHALHANVSWKWQIKANGMLISASPCVYWGIGVAYFSHFRLIFRCEWKKWAFCDDFIIIVYNSTSVCNRLLLENSMSAPMARRPDVCIPWTMIWFVMRTTNRPRESHHTRAPRFEWIRKL